MENMKRVERKKQLVFGYRGQLKEDHEGKNPRQLRNFKEYERVKRDRADQRAVCPFCLNIGTLDDFTIYEEDYKISRYVQCPRCMERMEVRTSKIFDKGAFEYSKWFWYSFYYGHAWKRMDVENVKKVVRELGIDNIFWSIWKKAKARYNTDMLPEKGYRQRKNKELKPPKLDEFMGFGGLRRGE